MHIQPVKLMQGALGFVRRTQKIFAYEDSFQVDLEELDESQLASADRAFRHRSLVNSLRSLVVFFCGLLLYIACYVAMNTNMIPALVSLTMCLSTLMTICVGIRSKRTSQNMLFHIAVSLSFLWLHIAMVAGEAFVQKVAFFDFHSIVSHLRDAPGQCPDSLKSCWDLQRIKGGGRRTDEGQLFIVMLFDVYYILLILPSRLSLFLLLPSLACYVIPVLSLGGRFDEGGWEILGCTVACALLCVLMKSENDANLNNFITAVQFKHQHVIDEKIRRCEAEFKADTLQDKINLVAPGDRKSVV